MFGFREEGRERVSLFYQFRWHHPLRYHEESGMIKIFIKPPAFKERGSFPSETSSTTYEASA